MKYLIALMIAGLSVSAFANENPLVKKYNCGVKGCDLLCLNEADQWLTLEGQADTIIASLYANGNTEYLLKRGVKGDKVVFVGANNPQCKIEGIN